MNYVYLCTPHGHTKPANAPSAWDHTSETQTQHTPSTRNADPNKAHPDPSTTRPAKGGPQLMENTRPNKARAGPKEEWGELEEE